MASHAPAKSVDHSAPPPPVPSAPPSVKRDGPEPEINKLFRLQIKFEASDLHLQTNKPPMLRIKGEIRELEMPPLTAEQLCGA